MSAPYVYAVLVDGVTRYIGKGRGQRAFDHARIAAKHNDRRACGERVRTTRFYCKLAAAIRDGRLIEVVILATFETDQDAFAVERELISEIGPEHLWNDRQGGEGFTSADSLRMWSSQEFRRAHAERTREALGKPDVKRRKSRSAAESWRDPEMRERRITGMDRTRWDPEIMERRSRAVAESWRGDAEARKRRLRGIHNLSGDALESKRQKIRASWQDPDTRARRIQSIREKNASPEGFEARSRGSRKRWADPAYREKLSAARKANWADPETRERILKGRREAKERRRSGVDE